jgi:hypothetical protein
VTWSDFYLICFLVGFAFSVLAILSGGLRLHIPHLPHGHAGGMGHGAGMGHAPAGPHGPSGTPGPAAGKAGGAARGGQISPFNFVTFTAFLAWFGGVGYLLNRYEPLWFMAGLVLAVAGGLAGGGVVYWFLAKVLTSPDESMDPADYEMVGVWGRMSLPIREGGTGELIYSQAGTRRVCGARSEDGSGIEKGAEVVVTRYERGIAYVRRWEEMSGES